MKSSRNKTIDFPLDNGKQYLDRVVDGKTATELPKNRTICGDTYSLIEKIPDKSVDLLIVDPPYNLDKYYHGNTFKKMKNVSYAEYTEKWISLVKQKLKDTASIYVCCDWQSALVIGGILQKHFILRNRITWQREKGRGAKQNWKNSMEDVFFATVGEDYTFNLNAVKQRKRVLAPYKDNGEPKDWQETAEGKYRNTCPSNFWDDIAVPYWSMAENTAHPTQKPEKLIAKLVLASSNEGDVVLDPFAGSGTTSVVCKKLNRDFISIEQNLLYCAWAEKRLELAEKDRSIQGYEDGVFWERNSRPKRQRK
ncbi:MAG: site-specific DNA-methyltransferase [Clostridiales bacterium]|nr:site-specific DNA-methyltransferase [Clostridiales bacterium]